MNDRIREMLGWYGGDNPGTLTNLARILNHGRLGGTGRLVVLPVDQGFEHGPARSFAMNPTAYDPRYHFQLAILDEVRAIRAGGGFGSVMGRNMFQRPKADALRLLGQIMDIYAGK
jgi:fructose-bisphosphate aldolase, class I